MSTERTSRRLAFLLRHSPEFTDSRGRATIASVLEELNISRAVFDDIVSTDTKGRYLIEGGMVRAVQGHSFDVQLDLEPTTPPTVLYHGTARRFVRSISRQGILPQRRHAVHLSATTEGALAVAQRRSEPVLLTVDAAAMSADGHLFYVSENGVWLTETVPARYLRFS